MTEMNWRLFPYLDKDKIEIVKFQSKPLNEFQIFINGVPMLPLGFPLTEITGDGEYTIVQQNLEPIRHNFSYGKSFVFKNKNIVAVIDQMMRLGVLKTQKSYLPPYLNLSQRVISRSIFNPGQITRGVGQDQIVPVNDNEVKGVTNAEFGFIEKTMQFLDRNTVSQTFGGSQEPGGNVTATQILELQRQARLMIGLTVLAGSLLEKKLDSKRVVILLRHWFDPIDRVVDKARNALVDRFRIVSRDRSIEGEGPGVRFIIPTTSELPTSRQVKDREKKFKRENGFPAKFVFLNPDQLKQAKLTWVVSPTAKERKSSELSKIMFGNMLTQATDLVSVGALLPLNPSYNSERFAEVWDEDPNKMFTQAPPGVQPGQPGAIPGQPGGTPPPGSPSALIPKPKAPSASDVLQ